MKPQEKIGGSQLFALLFVCRALALFTFTAPQETGFSAGDRILFTAPFCLLCLLFAVPGLLAGSRHANGVLGAARAASPMLAKGVGVFYSAAFLCAAALSTLRFELFVGTVMYPERETTLLIALLLAAAAAAAVHGTQALGRAAVILLALFAASLLFILCSAAGQFDRLNLTPPLENGASPVLRNAFRSAARTAELPALAFAPAFTRGRVNKTGVCWLTSFSAMAAMVFCFLGGVAGVYGEQQMFPLYTVTTVAKLGVFERLDAVLTGLWVLGAFLRTAFFLRLAGLSLEQSFGKRLSAAPFFAGAAAVFALFLAFGRLSALTDGAAATAATEALFIASSAVAPTVVLLAARRKKTERQTNLTG